jgi:hypothetical protein
MKQRFNHVRAAVVLGSVVALAGSAPLAAQTAPLESYEAPMFVDSGEIENTSEEPAVVFATIIDVPDATWLRLSFDLVQLSGGADESGSYLRITSTLDGAMQYLEARHVVQWSNTSAYFNGSEVMLELIAQPNSGPNRIVMSEVTAGLPPVESTCGPTDDRERSYDLRAARLVPIGCTIWLIDDCSHCMITAGHCIQNGTTNAVAEFNVPLSTGSGQIVHPPVEDQYPIDPVSIQSNGGGGVGNDFAYCGAPANSNTGLTAFEAQGAAYTLAATPPPVTPGSEIRITGFGTVTSPVSPTWNQVQKTHVGPYAAFFGSTVQYRTDTSGGNSGSPVIDEQSGLAIGVHTHGGCNSTGGQNSGTGVNHAGWQTALANPRGVCICPGLNFVYPNGRPEFVAPNGGTAVAVVVEASSLHTPAPGTGQFHYDDGSGFVAVPMTQTAPNQYTATFPVLPCGTTVRYYFSAESTGGERFSDPPNAPTSTFSAGVRTGITELYHFNFESAPDWFAENLGATSGDWQRGVPVNDPGWAYDPISDSDGSGQCWLTQNQFGNTDVDNGAVRLTSSSFDMAGRDVLISYDYFLNLTNTSGGVDRLLVEISSNDLGGPWIEIARHTISGALNWRRHEVDQGALNQAGVTMTATMRLRFTANDGEPQSINESGLDAFDISEIQCGCRGDLNGDGRTDLTDLGILLADFGCAAPGPCAGDLDGDGDTDLADLGILLADFGCTP